MTSRLLHIVHVEDDDADAELTCERLKNDGIGCAVSRVQTRAEFENVLRRERVDLIISDFTLPGFDGLLALQIARQRHPEVPFIFLSGTLGEELAVEALKQGATDYIIKDRISRLASSVRRAVREAPEAAKHRAMEEQIREQAALLDQARDAICVNDMSQQILFWNKSCERLYGWTAKEALGRSTNELLFQQDMTGPREALRSLIRKGEWQGELHQVTKDEKRIVVESRWTLLRDAAGSPKSILVINTDITEKKQIEAQLLRTQRIETIGALAGGIAHDLNNALTPILMGVGILGREKISPGGAQTLELMASSARRGAEMVRQILSFSRGVGGEQARINLKELVQEMVKLAGKTFPSSIRIRMNVEDGLGLLVGNPTQLHQVLLNLCVNARDAMPGGGSLDIEAKNVVFDSGGRRVAGELRTGTWVLLKVADTGHGIPPELKEKIFEPFFTTKAAEHGTGLGLSTVMGIVKTHGGFLDLASEPGRGTEFRIYLPARNGGEAGANRG